MVKLSKKVVGWVRGGGGPWQISCIFFCSEKRVCKRGGELYSYEWAVRLGSREDLQSYTWLFLNNMSNSLNGLSNICLW